VGRPGVDGGRRHPGARDAHGPSGRPRRGARPRARLLAPLLPAPGALARRPGPGRRRGPARVRVDPAGGRATRRLHRIRGSRRVADGHGTPGFRPGRQLRGVSRDRRPGRPVTGSRGAGRPQRPGRRRPVPDMDDPCAATGPHRAAGAVAGVAGRGAGRAVGRAGARATHVPSPAGRPDRGQGPTGRDAGAGAARHPRPRDAASLGRDDVRGAASAPPTSCTGRTRTRSPTSSPRCCPRERPVPALSQSWCRLSPGGGCISSTRDVRHRLSPRRGRPRRASG
jgi:hypothetical protein